ncbi:MAG: GspH/FimT family pseudopilin [Burkholderiaceae bacterium]
MSNRYRKIRRPSRNSASGFTLIELVVVVTIVAILTGLALPSFASFIRRTQIANASNDLISGFNYARAEAIKLGTPVVVCPSTNFTSCAGGTAWENGSIAYVDTNANGAVDAGEVVFRRTPAAPVGITIELGGAAPVSAIRFAPNGLLHGANAGYRMTIANANSPTGSNEERYICVARGGRAVAMSFNTYANDARFNNCGG